MEIRMTVHVPRRRPAPCDVVVSASGGATAADLADALGNHLGLAVAGLLVGGTPLPPDAGVGLPPLLDGVSVVVRTSGQQVPVAGGAGAHPRPVLRLVSVAGPDAGRSHPLAPPGVDLGRGPDRGLRLEDPALSRIHAHVDVRSDGVRIDDLGSTNGVLVDGRPTSGPTPVDTASRISLGTSEIRLRRVPGPGLPVDHPGDGTATLVPARAESSRAPAAVVPAPAPPPEPVRVRVPWVAALVPLPVVAVLAIFLGPQILAFAVIGPLAVIATSVADRLGGRRRRRRDLERHATELAAAQRRFEQALAAEAIARHRAHPDADEVLCRAEHRRSGLWSGGGDLVVRLGLGAVPSATTWVGPDGVAETGLIEAAPVLLDLDAVRCLGIVGDVDTTERVAAALVGQLLVRCPPSALAVVPSDVDREGAARPWWAWTPHRRGTGRRLVVGTAAAARGSGLDAPGAAPGDDVAVLTATDAADLPDACRAVLTPVGGGRWRLQVDDSGQDLVVDAVGPGWAERLGRALTPLREGGGDGCSAIPDTLGLDELEVTPLTPAGVRARWARSRGPRAVVGRSSSGPFTIDLASDGPHVLVGGTTGSGKSEFLRTLVTSLALGSPPTELTMLLVDFKGGAAFGACAGLPHVVGVVSDLDDHLVDRVLRSLGAELRRRERLLAGVGASDLEDYRRRPGAAPLPRLVVVVDELRTLVDALPDVVDRLVRLAAQGRSLGMHLVLATQRPAGTVTAEIRANVNLRIAFRVRDHADSVGVVDDGRAADLPADVPGRAVVRGGDGRVVTVQCALVRRGDSVGPRVRVRRAGRSDGGVTGVDVDERDRSAQTRAVVELVAAAQAYGSARAPVPPWLPPLPDRLPREDTDARTVALTDDPDGQRRPLLRWDPDVPLWRLVGPTRSGRTVAARAVVLAATTALPRSTDLHVHVLGAGDEHDDLRGLAQVGTVARADDSEAVRALLDRIAVDLAAPTGPTVLLVVDGWERLLEASDARHPSGPADLVQRLVRDSGGRLAAVVTGGRDLLRSGWSALGGEVLLLGGHDPLDLALAGLAPGVTARGDVPGRGLRVADGLALQVVDASAPVPAPAVPAGHGPDTGGGRPWRYRPLPTLVSRSDLPDGDGDGDDGLLIGVAGPEARPRRWDPAVQGRRLLVLGPSRSGRSATLRALARSAVDTGRHVVLVGGGTRTPGADGPDCAWPALDAADVEALVALRAAHPDLLVLVDDADRLDESPLRPVLTEIGDLVDRDGGGLVVVSSPVALRTRFRGLDVDVARHGTAVVLQPDPGDGEPLGLRSLPGARTTTPGRGLLVSRGEVETLQVLAPDEEPALTPGR